MRHMHIITGHKMCTMTSILHAVFACDLQEAHGAPVVQEFPHLPSDQHLPVEGRRHFKTSIHRISPIPFTPPSPTLTTHPFSPFGPGTPDLPSFPYHIQNTLSYLYSYTVNCYNMCVWVIHIHKRTTFHSILEE